MNTQKQTDLLTAARTLLAAEGLDTERQGAGGVGVLLLYLTDHPEGPHVAVDLSEEDGKVRVGAYLRFGEEERLLVDVTLHEVVGAVKASVACLEQVSEAWD